MYPVYQNLRYPVYLPKHHAPCLPKPQVPCLFTETSGTLFVYQNPRYPVCLPKPQAPCLFTKTSVTLFIYQNLRPPFYFTKTSGTLFTQTLVTLFIYQNLRHSVYLPKPQAPCLFTKTSGTLFVYQKHISVLKVMRKTLTKCYICSTPVYINTWLTTVLTLSLFSQFCTLEKQLFFCLFFTPLFCIVLFWFHVWCSHFRFLYVALQSNP